MELSLEQVGFLGGDFSWWKADLEWTQFFLLGTDDQGRNRVLRWNARVGNIFDSVPRVPLWERYYLGGNSLRGFENRTISPKSVRASDGEPSSDPIGGSFLAFAGLQYEHPLVGENFALAVFVDSGTVLQNLGGVVACGGRHRWPLLSALLGSGPHGHRSGLAPRSRGFGPNSGAVFPGGAAFLSQGPSTGYPVPPRSQDPCDLVGGRVCESQVGSHWQCWWDGSGPIWPTAPPPVPLLRSLLPWWISKKSLVVLSNGRMPNGSCRLVPQRSSRR